MNDVAKDWLRGADFAGEKEMTFTTTLNKIRERGQCWHGWEALLRNLDKTKADDEPLTLLMILKSGGFDDALWSCRAVDGHDRDFRLFGVWCARRVQHLLTDSRSLAALDVSERYANGDAAYSELAAAHAAAHAATRALAESAAWGAACAAAATTAWRAAWAAACSAGWAMEGASAGVEEKARQEARFRQMLADGAFIGSTHPEASDE